jgi:integrase
MPLTLSPPRAGKTSKWSIRGTVSAKVRGTLRSITINETTGVTDRSTAETIRIQREAEILNELVFGVRASRSLRQAVMGYAEEHDREAKPLRGTQRAHVLGRRRSDGSLSPHLLSRFDPDVLVSAIDQDMVDAVIRRDFPHRVAAATIMNAVIIPLTAVLNYAARRRWCDTPKFKRLKVAKHRTRWPTYEEADRILAAAMPYSRPLYLFLMMTGARFGEAISLDWRDVNLLERWAVLRNTKRNGEDRGIPLHPQVQRMLANLPHRDGRVFRTWRGEPFADIDDDRARRGSIKTAWASTLRRAGITEPLRIHDLQHGFSSWLTAMTMSFCQQQVRDEIMGHASTNMGRHYAHLPRQPLLDAVALLPERGFEPDPVLLEELAATWTNQQRRQILYANANGMPAMPPRRIIKKNTNGTSAASRKRIKKRNNNGMPALPRARVRKKNIK